MLSMPVIISQVDECCKFSTFVAWNVPATSGFLNFSNLSLDWADFLVFFRRTRKSPPMSAPG